MVYVTCIKSSCILLQSGNTPLHVAAAAAETSGRDNEQVVEILIKAGADVHATNKVSYYSFIV